MAKTAEENCTKRRLYKALHCIATPFGKGIIRMEINGLGRRKNWRKKTTEEGGFSNKEKVRTWDIGIKKEKKRKKDLGN
jgi:hypothetical protein